MKGQSWVIEQNNGGNVICLKCNLFTEIAKMSRQGGFEVNFPLATTKFRPAEKKLMLADLAFYVIQKHKNIYRKVNFQIVFSSCHVVQCHVDK